MIKNPATSGAKPAPMGEPLETVKILDVRISHVALGFPMKQETEAIQRLRPVLNICSSQGQLSEAGMIFLPSSPGLPCIELADTGPRRAGDLTWNTNLETKEFILPTGNPAIFENFFSALEIDLEHGGFRLSFVQATGASALFHVGIHMPDKNQLTLLKNILLATNVPELREVAKLITKHREKAGPSGEFRFPLGKELGGEIEVTYGPQGLKGHKLTSQRFAAPESPIYARPGDSTQIASVIGHGKRKKR